jgi:hypothetical protein
LDGWLVLWLVGWMVLWLVGWLVGSLVGWLVVGWLCFQGLMTWCSRTLHGVTFTLVSLLRNEFQFVSLNSHQSS